MAGTPYLDVQNLTKRFGADVLFRDLSFGISEGQRVGLIAKNGTGKTTLLNILTDREGREAGTIIYKNDLRVGYLEQSPRFDSEESVLDACFNHEGEEEKVLRAKQILTQLHIDDLTQPMGQLSGGQQKRVALANVLITQPDLLILDEPTNHLDMTSKDVLKEAIKAFDGTAIVVSHDREFLDGLVSKVYEFGGGKVTEHLGGIYDYLLAHNVETIDEFHVPERSQPEEPKPNDTPSSGKVSYAEHKEQQKRIRKIEREVAQSEDKISKMEQRIKELDEILCDPAHASDMVLITEYTDIQKALTAEENNWEKLSEQLESLQSGC